MRAPSHTIAIVLGVMVFLAAAAAAQTPPRTARLGLLSSGVADRESAFWRAFREGLRERGWEEGKNLALEQRFAAGQFDRLPGLAAELVRLNVDVLVAAGAPAVQAARKAAGSTPIVMTNTADPVGLGLVTSLARPGGNITGLSDFNTSLVGKRVHLLKELVPSATRIAVLLNPANPTNVPQGKLAEEAAAPLGIAPTTYRASRPEDLERAFAEMKTQRNDALLVIGDPFFRTQRSRILQLVARHRIPSNFSTPEWSADGGLSSYGVNFTDLYRRSADYVDKILRGAKPGDLPIEQPTTLELVVNLKVARELGLVVPRSILARADRVIE